VLLCFALPLEAASAAPLLVTSSDNSDIQAGDIVDSKTIVRLESGARLTLIDSDGASISLEGPYDGTPVEDGADISEDRTVLDSLGKLFAGGEGANTIKKGATRGASARSSTIGVWQIDTGSQGDVCVPTGGAITLWRENVDKASVLTLRHKESGKSANVDWPAGVAGLNWPTALPIEDGANYLLRLKGVLIARKRTLHLVPDNLPTELHRAAWMVENGCESQARSLLSLIR